MLNLSAYIPSLEDHDAIPSPLMDGDAVPAVVAPIAAINEPGVEPGDDVGALPLIEDVVELPPHLDPTPLAPLEGEVIQEEIISEQLDTEAGQLMGAQIALEGYSKLLRSSGANMTRQSAAFMAVGMRRATRLMPGVSLGMEDESSGTQVMAMQKAKVDEKGVGQKLKEIGSKIWEWIKEQFAKLRGMYDKLMALFKQEKPKVVYLLAATEAVESGNPAKVEKLEAPQGIKVAQVLDAIHGEDVRAPKQKSIKLNPKFSRYLVQNGKFDFGLQIAADYRAKGAMAYYKDMTSMAEAIISFMSGIKADVNVEEAADKISDIRKQHMSGKAGKWELPGLTVVRSEEGVLTVERDDGPGETEITMPSLAEIREYLGNVNKVIDGDDPEMLKVVERFQAAGQKLMSLPNLKALPGDVTEKLGGTLQKVLLAGGKTMDSNLLESIKHIAGMRAAGIQACDMFLATYLGKGNTISQEDFERLPSKGLAVVNQPGGPNALQRGAAMARQAWEKLKAWFRAKWEQFTTWAKNLWNKLFGIDQQTDVLLLTNNAIPEDGAGGSSGPLPELPNGTRLKSVQAARSIAGPAAGSTAPAPAEVVPEPAPASQGLPNGMVYVQEAGELMLNGQLQIDPVWEEEMTNWLVRHYIPTQEKIARDLTSFAGTEQLDVGIMGVEEIIHRAVPQLFQGMPTNVPGHRTIAQGEGTKIQIRQEGMMPQVEPVKIIKKRQIDQALSRQKKVLKVLEGFEKTRIVTERQRAALNAILDRRVAAGMSESVATRFYDYMENSVFQTSAVVVAGVIGRICAARVAVCDTMIAARAKR